MNEILLDENQTTVVSQSRASVQVRDPAGALVGYIVPNGVQNGQHFGDPWIESWNEWYLEIDEAELENAR